MANEQSTNGGRKQARSKRATKRDDDVVQQDDGGGDDASPIERSDATATPRKAQDGAPSTDTDGADETDDSDDTPTPKAQQADPAARGEAWLSELFERMNLDLRARGSYDDENYIFNITGPDSDDLIGRSRQSPKLVRAIQTLLTEHLGRDARGNVVVDIGGFKKKRQSQLIGVADKLGDTAKRLGKSMTIAGLDKYERRVIHQGLADEEGVDTDSVGDGIFRKLRVLSD